jgi:hypothetical protein
MATMRVESLTTSSATTVDKRALAEIYERYSPDIFRYACRLLDDGGLDDDGSDDEGNWDG